jgi:hypothetical protein
MMPTATGRSIMRCAPAAAPTRCSPLRTRSSFFQAALDAMEQRPEPDEAARCRLLFLLGEAQRRSNDFPNALITLRETARAAEGLGLPDVLAQAALAYEQAAWRSRLSPDPPPGRLLEAALRDVQQADPALHARLAGALGRALLYADAEDEARAQIAEAIALARSVGDPAVLAVNISHLFNFFWRGPRAPKSFFKARQRWLPQPDCRAT